MAWDPTTPTTLLGPSGEGRVVAAQIGAITRYPLIDGRKAIGGALRAYLLCQTFTAWGKDAPNRTFKLNRMDTVWPDPQQKLDVPLGVILDEEPGRQDAFALTPVPLEETWDREKCTVLWKTAELVATVTADFWLGDEVEREGLMAALPAIFSPSEDRYGVFIETSPAYFSLPCRVSYMDAQRMDEAGSIYPRERRVSVTLKAEIAVVYERRAIEFRPDVELDVKPAGCP